MKKTFLLTTCVLISFFYSANGFALTAQQAFQEGKTLATQEKDITKQKGYINDAPNIVPGYTSKRSEESLFGGASLTSNAIAKQNSCSTNPQQDGKVENHQECEAVNFLAGRPSLKSKSAYPDLSSDPAVVANMNVSQNIQSVLNQFGYSNTTSQTNCTNKSITNPAQFIESSCIEGYQVEAQSCSYGRDIVIDSDSNYQCNETVNAYEVIDCEKTYGCPNGGYIDGIKCVITEAPYSPGSNCFPEGVVFSQTYADWPLMFDLSQQSSGIVIARSSSWDYKVSSTYSRVLKASVSIPDISAISRFSVRPLGPDSYDDWLIVVINGVGVASSIGSGYTSFGYVVDADGWGSWAAIGPSGTYNLYPENKSSPSINLYNLLPYLQQGNNTIEIHLLSGGKYGLLNVGFDFTGRCPVVCPTDYILSGGQCKNTYNAALVDGCKALELRAK